MRKEIIRQLIEAGYALAVTYSVGKWAFTYAYRARGYEAVGSEYLLVLLTYWIAYKSIHYLFDVLEEERYAGRRKCKKKGSRRSARIHNHR